MSNSGITADQAASSHGVAGRAPRARPAGNDKNDESAAPVAQDHPPLEPGTGKIVDRTI